MRRQYGGQVSKCLPDHLLFMKTTLFADNYSILLSHFTRQTGMDVQDIRRYLEIGDDYEDIF
jgi:hypothetical protein